MTRTSVADSRYRNREPAIMITNKLNKTKIISLNRITTTMNRKIIQISKSDVLLFHLIHIFGKVKLMKSYICPAGLV